ncbi:CDK5 regulatory subunit-associated protein 2 isoform X6 [Gadus macrocephalus]|uniref:CDK5 regulatory subunit-associated protein 2 isoform X6 n=1 Tax=Gadus macrocephalus TaxID=80720 RepID=UPI0028CBBD3E|nr:CDK5 regulatory subunit-associated protein 2 isoform X6 [Gadus macrocephalus]
MKDPCRVCGVRLVGSQCRWIFSATGQRQLQVILSHVLGLGVTRGDGRGEFLCGKCVFQLEKVIHCDIAINRLQEEHGAQVQKLQAEKENVIQCLNHIYSKNNSSHAKGDGEGPRSKTPVRSSGCGSPIEDDEVVGQLASESRPHRDADVGQVKNRMRRCVSLDRLGGKAATPARSGLRRPPLRPGSGSMVECSAGGLQAARHRSQSMYLDLVNRKGSLPSPGFKSRSTSLQSLNQDFASKTFTDPQPKRHLREPIPKKKLTNGSKAKDQARTRHRSPTVQPSLISDLVQLLHCISRRPILAPPDSRIPLLQKTHSGHTPPNLLRTKRRSREAQWKSLHDLTEEFNDEYTPVTEKGFAKREHDVSQLESTNKLLNNELTQIKSSNEHLTKTLAEAQNQSKALSGKLDEKENDLCSERKNSLKRDKTIQGLSQVLKEKEKEILELCHEIEDRDEALAKARETAHKAQLQKYQGAEEHQSLLMEKQAELAHLQGEHHTKVLEAQKLQRALARREQELADMQQAKEQLEFELEDFQQQKKKGDKALNDLQNQLKKLSGEIGDRESALEQHYQALLDETTRKLQVHEVSIQRLTSTLADKEQQLQEYLNMVRDFEQSRSPGGSDVMLSKLRDRLKEKEKALEKALDEKFAAIEEKDNEIHQLQLALREKERDLERLNNLLTHNNETINSFDSVIKEKDVELQHLANTLNNLQRAKQDLEDNLNRALREKDSIISQLQLSLQGKTNDMEEMAQAMLSQSQSQAHDLAEKMGQRLKVTEAMLAEATKARENLVTDNESAVEGLLATIGSKDKLLKESSEHYNRMLSEYTREIQELKRQLVDGQQQLRAAEKHRSTATQDGHLEAAELKLLLVEKDSLIKELMERGQNTDWFLAEPRIKEESDHVLELKHTVQILKERLIEREAELTKMNGEGHIENITVTRRTMVILKKELAQQTEALNKALKRENGLKISLAELQSTLAELEALVQGHQANAESLTSTLETKDQIIAELHQRLGQRGDRQTGNGQEHGSATDTGAERSTSSLPQRERTIIGGDSQQKDLPSLSSVHDEHAALTRALKTEQQLFSSLIRTVKEQDSSQRLHALQLELTAVQLLRQQLEEGIRTNEGLRDQLEGELLQAQLREGVDPQELQSMRHQLEDAQRWNASLQARLGAIQNRAAGVGGANDTGDSLTFLGDQTSYMSICVGDRLEESLSQLSASELRQKVVVLQECVSGLQSVNIDLQQKALLLERKEDKENLSHGNTSPRTQLLAAGRAGQRRGGDGTLRPGPGQRSPMEVLPPQTGSQSHCDHDDRSSFSTGEHQIRSGDEPLEQQEHRMEEMVLQGTTSQLRDELLRLGSENKELRCLLREEVLKESEWKARSEDVCDGPAGLHQTVLRLRDEATGHLKVIGSLKEQLERKAVEVSDWERRNGTLEGPPSTQLLNHTPARQRLSHKAGVRSRLPVPVRLISEPGSTFWVANQPHTLHQHTDTVEPLRDIHLNHISESDQLLSEGLEYPLSLERSTTPGSNFDEYIHRSSCSQTVSDDNPEDGEALLDDARADSCALLAQLELLHQECQEKESLIDGLEDKLAEWEEIHTQLHEKDCLNRQYAEALQAAESTIAYLTACNLDSHSGLGLGQLERSCAVSAGSDGSALQKEIVELNKTLQEKERLNAHLVEFLNMTGRDIATIQASLTSPTAAASLELCSRLVSALQQMNASLAAHNPRGTVDVPWGSDRGQEQSMDRLQQGSWELNRLDTECEVGTPSEASGVLPVLNHTGTQHKDYLIRQIAGESVNKGRSRDVEGTSGCSEGSLTNGEITKCLSDCLAAAESAIASLAAHCTNTQSLSSGTSAQISPDLQHHLQRLQISLQELGDLEDQGQVEAAKKPSYRHGSAASAGRKSQPSSQELHRNIHLLYQAFCEHSQRISNLQASLQEERRLRGENQTQAPTVDGLSSEGIPGNVQAQLEGLQKALKDKKRTCKILEEKLASSLKPVTIHNLPCDPAQKTPPLEQDDKCVQVDLQDLGYETSGKSENDREESSSTDLKGCLQPGDSACSLPSLLKEVQGSFSSAEYLDSTSTSYPSSPALSSNKVSLKSLQAFEDYGVSEDPVELKAQVMELRLQLENQTRVAQQMQSLLGRHIFPSNLVSTPVDASRDQHAWPGVVYGRSQERSHSAAELKEGRDGEVQRMREEIGVLKQELERERSLNRNISEQLQQVQQRSRSASPARLDSLVQSQARELSALRQQIKERRGLGLSHRRQLEELSRAFQELLQASDVDLFRGDILRGQLDKSMGILERLEGWLDRGDGQQDNKDALDLAQRLSRELQEKNQQVQSLQSQLRGPSGASSCCSSSSERSPSYVVSGSGRGSPTAQSPTARSPSTHSGALAPHGHIDGGGAKAGGGVDRSPGDQSPGDRHRSSRTQGARLWRENGRLQEQLRGSQELNATLRSELELQRSVQAQPGPRHPEPRDPPDGPGSPPQADSDGREAEARAEARAAARQDGGPQAGAMTTDLLAEHLQEIRALRRRLEESIQTNERLREQLERRLAEVERDPATNIFIQGSEEQGQMASEVRFLWEQNRSLKEQLAQGSRDKQKENEALREALARRTARLEQSRAELEALRQERARLTPSAQENQTLSDALQRSRDELHRLQSDVNLQRQQLSDSQHLLQSLRVELQVCERIKTDAPSATEGEGSPRPPGPLDLSELLAEVRRLRLQLETSIQTNTALRQRLEEQLLMGRHADTININYLLPASDEGGRSPGQENRDPAHRASHSPVLRETRRREENSSQQLSSCSSSSESGAPGPPSRLVPGHRLWASRHGPHVLGLIQDHHALRKQISEGRRLTQHMDAQLQEGRPHLRSLSSSVGTMQQVLEEASRLLHLVWRVSLPTGGHTAGEHGSNQQEELLRSEVSRLRSRLSQQERLLSGAVKRLRTTNQLKEGMEKVIIDQLSVTHGVLKKARGNLETNNCALFGLKGLSGGPEEEVPINGQ